MRNKGAKSRRLTGILGLSLIAGCATRGSLSIYSVSNSFERAPPSCYNSRKEFYNSIGTEVTPDEARYIEKFKKMPAKDRKTLLNDALLRNFNFLNRNNPGIADVIFLKEINSRVNPAVLKGF